MTQPYWRNLGSIEEAVFKVIGGHLGIPGTTLNLEMTIKDDLSADSLDQQELIMTIEELFDIRITDSEVGEIKRIKDIVSLLKKKITPDEIDHR